MTVSRDTENAAAERVLLIGNQWDPLNTTLKALAKQGGLTFVGPSDKGTPEILSLVDPAVIMVGPGCDSAAALGESALAGERGTLRDTAGAGVRDPGGPGKRPFSLRRWGVEDFLVVPCSEAELEWRLRRLARRSFAESSGSCLEVGRIALDPNTYQVRLSGRVVPMAWMEFQLLKFLMENVGRVFITGTCYCPACGGFDSFGGTRTVDVHIRKLRSKLEIHGELYFRTVKNVGYGMVTPGQEANPTAR